MSEGFSTFDHTGDLGLEVWAGSPERLYALAAVALMAQIARPLAPDAPGADVRLELRLEGGDERDLLVHWLNTALLESELRGAVWTRAQVDVLTARTLEGSLEGPRFDRTRFETLREVKAVSHHYLELVLRSDDCRCRLILDI